MSKGQQEKALDKAVFAAKKGELEGPVKTQFGYYVFEVSAVKAASQQTLEQAKETIRNLLRSQREQKALDEFVKDFREKYKDETNCADDYRVAECKNAPKDAHRHRAGLGRRSAVSRRAAGAPGRAPQTPQGAAPQGAAPQGAAPQGAPPQAPQGATPQTPAAAGSDQPVGAGAGADRGGRGRARAPRRDHPAAAARVPVGPRAGRALDRAAHGRGGLRAGRRRPRRRRRQAAATSWATCCSRSIFLSLLLEERGAGDLAAVAERCREKLIRRHPHVFGDAQAGTAGEVLRNWDRIKSETEGAGPFGDLPETLPSTLLREEGPAPRGRAPEGAPAVPAVADADESLHGAEGRDRRFEAAGELLLAAVAAAVDAGADPELALRAAADRYVNRAQEARAQVSEIEQVHARQILDSRGNPTVEVEVTLASGRQRPRRGALRRLHRRVRGRGAARRRRAPGAARA